MWYMVLMWASGGLAQFEAMFPTPEITRTAEELISDRAGAALWSAFGKNVRFSTATRRLMAREIDT